MRGEIKYFGYGANRSAPMMEAIIGRRPAGFEAILPGYELCVQTWGQMPRKVRKNLLEQNWGPEFRTYAARAADDKAKRVAGVVWSITGQERALLANWELDELWYDPVNVSVVDGRGRVVERVDTQIIDDPALAVVNGKRYRVFLNDRAKHLAVARRVGAAYLKEQRE